MGGIQFKKYNTVQRITNPKAGKPMVNAVRREAWGKPCNVRRTIFQTMPPVMRAPVTKTILFIHPVTTGKKNVIKLKVTKANRLTSILRLE